jgi:hypothetical protein
MITPEEEKDCNVQTPEYYAKLKKEHDKIRLAAYFKTEESKESKKEYQSRLFTCDCGSKIKLGSRSKHFRTKIHLESMEKMNTLN